jgi:hypothetical protein
VAPVSLAGPQSQSWGLGSLVTQSTLTGPSLEVIGFSEGFTRSPERFCRLLELVRKFLFRATDTDVTTSSSWLRLPSRAQRLHRNTEHAGIYLSRHPQPLAEEETAFSPGYPLLPQGQSPELP